MVLHRVDQALGSQILSNTSVEIDCTLVAVLLLDIHQLETHAQTASDHEPRQSAEAVCLDSSEVQESSCTSPREQIDCQ
jgi:hypothetical protein